MNKVAKEIFWDNVDPNSTTATRFRDGKERLIYDVEFVKKFIPQNGAVLDLGCGTGVMTLELKKYASIVYAVDYIAAFLDKIPDQEGLIKRVSDANTFCEKENFFDVITIFGAIQYNVGKDLIMIYENCYKMLKKGGVLLVSGQLGVNNTVTINNYSHELKSNYYAEYRTVKQETDLLDSVGCSTRVEDILPEKFNRFENTKFHCLVAEK